MQLRAAAETEPLRPTASAPEFTKPADFPVTACEARLPRAATRASLAGRPLPLPKAVVRRIVVFGDTGCRLKAADKAYGENRLGVALYRVKALKALGRRDDAKQVVAEVLEQNGQWFPEQVAKLKAELAS